VWGEAQEPGAEDGLPGGRPVDGRARFPGETKDTERLRPEGRLGRRTRERRKAGVLFPKSRLKSFLAQLSQRFCPWAEAQDKYLGGEVIKEINTHKALRRTHRAPGKCALLFTAPQKYTECNPAAAETVTFLLVATPCGPGLTVTKD
jgi:hypothetical protein